MLNNFLDKYIFTGGMKYVHNNFSLMGIPFLMLPTGLLVSLARREDSHFNKEIYYTIKYSMAGLLEKQFRVNCKVEGEKGVLIVQELFSAFGWGFLKQIDLDKEKKRAIVIVNSSPIALGISKEVKFPDDHFLRGFFAGLFSDYFESDVECVETKCSALNETKCEFVIKKKDDFDFSKKLVREQLDTDK